MKSQYVKWSKKMIVANMLGLTTWMSLSAFMLMSKNAIGLNNIPIFEMLILVAGIVGVSLAHEKYMTIKYGVLARNIQETIFLISLFYILITTGDLSVAGYSVYGVIISSSIVNMITDETIRSYEDAAFKSYSSRKFLKILRKRNKLLKLLAGAIGTSVSVIFLTIAGVDIITFTLCMLILNVAQNVYEFIIWKKYF